MKKHGTTILLVIIFLVGLCLLLYPTVSDWWNSRHQSKAIADYSQSVAQLDDDETMELLQQAHQYNMELKGKGDIKLFSDEEKDEYNSALDITGTGIMAYIDIPSINVSLPVYHGIDDSVLQIAVGHIEWSSLPVGGEGTHCIVSGHRGLPSAKLFTNLDKLVVGDVFMMHVLDMTITYQVDQILIVEPHDISSLNIIEGKDLCTLVTCTPYGINSHRLLVRGHRIENIPDTPVINVVSEAGVIDKMVVAPIVAAPILFALLIYVMIRYRKKK